MPSLIDYSSLLDEDFDVGAGLTVVKARPAGAMFLIAQTRDTVTNVEPVAGACYYRARTAGAANLASIDSENNPGVALKIPPTTADYQFVNLGVNNVHVWVSWLGTYDLQLLLGLLSLHQGSGKLLPLKQLPFSLAPGASLTSDRNAGASVIPIGTTHLVVSVLEVAGLSWTESYQTVGGAAVLWQLLYDNSLTPLAQQAQYGQPQLFPYNYVAAAGCERFVLTNTSGAATLAGTIHCLFQS